MPATPAARPGAATPGRGLSVGVAALLLTILCGAHPAAALSDSELFREVRFRFLEPGARAAAMGGAFGAVDGDLSSVHHNPAGLHFLASPEASLEYRMVDPDAEAVAFSAGGVGVDPVDGPTDLPFFQVTAGGEHDGVDELSFLGLAWPLEIGGSGHRLTLAFSRQLVLSLDRSLAGTGARFAFDTFPNTVVGTDLQVYSVQTLSSGNLTAEVFYWNGSLSYDVTGDFSVGLTVSYAELDMAGRSSTEIVDPLQLFFDPTHPRLGGQSDRDVAGTRVDGTDADLAFTVGMHWHPDSVFSSGRSPWGFSAVFARGARFEISEEATFNGILDRSLDTTFVVPDRAAIGLSYRTPLRWTFSAEIQRVEYSDLTDGFRAGVGFLASARLAGSAFLVDAGDGIEYAVDDSNVPRLGAEFRHRFAGGGGRTLAAQLGYFRTDDIRVRMSGFNSLDPAIERAQIESFSGDREVDHLTAGIGLGWRRFGFHLAAETSDEGRQLLAGFRVGVGRSAAGSAP